MSNNRGALFSVKVTLINSPEEKEFRCLRSGNLVMRYKGGEITDIIEGELLDSKEWKEVICKQCRVLYRFL
jgi:hypothetical protein